jgi:hydroxyacylglutathione hydrolase
MNLVAPPASADNNIWMLHDGRQALVVDPGDAAPVLGAPGRLGLALTGILVTHRRSVRMGARAGVEVSLGQRGAPAGPVSPISHEAGLRKPRNLPPPP